MHCPRCGQRFDAAARPVVCPNCGWEPPANREPTPQELLESYLKELDSLDAPSIIDRDLAARDAAHLAFGASGMLLRLGLISREEHEAFVRRVIKRTGIEIEFIEVEMQAIDETVGLEDGTEDT